jgi:hypothetical protein
VRRSRIRHDHQQQQLTITYRPTPRDHANRTILPHAGPHLISKAVLLLLPVVIALHAITASAQISRFSLFAAAFSGRRNGSPGCNAHSRGTGVPGGLVQHVFDRGPIQRPTN